MVQFLVRLRAELDGFYPGLSNAAVGAVAVLFVWLLKKFSPATFAKLPPALQAAPAMLLTAIVTGLSATYPTIASVVSNALGGALVGGTFAVGAHRVLKESPLPYGNPKPDPLVPPIHITIIVAVLVVGFGLGSATMLQSCTPAWRQALAVPVVSQADAIAMTLERAVDWAADHGVDAEAIQDARHVIATKDLGTAVELAKKLLEASAKAGEQVPPELVALVDVAEGALAAESVEKGMRALAPKADP